MVISNNFYNQTEPTREIDRLRTAINNVQNINKMYNLIYSKWEYKVLSVEHYLLHMTNDMLMAFNTSDLLSKYPLTNLYTNRPWRNMHETVKVRARWRNSPD